MPHEEPDKKTDATLRKHGSILESHKAHLMESEKELQQRANPATGRPASMTTSPTSSRTGNNTPMDTLQAHLRIIEQQHRMLEADLQSKKERRYAPKGSVSTVHFLTEGVALRHPAS